jgi:serine/threonine-protein kinase
LRNANFCASCGASIQLDSSSDDPYLGKLVDNTFMIESVLGVGSMGTVYKANHQALSKPVAVKILHQTLLTDRVVERRFELEAMAAIKLKHPHTIAVSHYGKTHTGAPYIAMEYLDGRDLAAVVTQDYPLPSKRIVALLSQVCRALEEAHRQGIIHRDLKPANIFVVDRRGEENAKVLDFGIAKIQGAASEGLTRDGLVCGTPAFMSPEQVSGQELGPASDIFSLGSILYFMLTLRLPFKGHSAVDVASSIMLDEVVAPSRVRLDANIPPSIEAVCLKALQKDPTQRYPSAAALREALDQAYQAHLLSGGDQRRRGVVIGDEESSRPITANINAATVIEMKAVQHQRTAIKSRRRRSQSKWLLPLFLCVLVLLLALVFFLLLLRSHEEPGPSTPPPPSPPPSSPATAVAPAAPAAPQVPEQLLPSCQRGLALAAAGLQLSTPKPTETHKGPTHRPSKATEIKTDTASPAEKRKERARQVDALFKDANSVRHSDPRRAVELLRQALKLDKTSWKCWELLGESYKRLGDSAAMANAFREVLELYPQHPRAARLQAAIDSAKP